MIVSLINGFVFLFYSCNTTAKPPTTIKVLLLGGDWLEGAVLRHYVDLLGVKPPDWVNHLRFYIVPIGTINFPFRLTSSTNKRCLIGRRFQLSFTIFVWSWLSVRSVVRCRLVATTLWTGCLIRSGRYFRSNESYTNLFAHRWSMHSDTDSRGNGKLQGRGFMSSVCTIHKCKLEIGHFLLQTMWLCFYCCCNWFRMSKLGAQILISCR